jgi:hypothetical protein
VCTGTQATINGDARSGGSPPQRRSAKPSGARVADQGRDDEQRAANHHENRADAKLGNPVAAADGFDQLGDEEPTADAGDAADDQCRDTDRAHAAT